MPSQRATLHRIAASGPADISGIEALFDDGLDPKTIVAVLGKTEGNGCVNDFTRGYATGTFETLFARYGVNGASIVMSGGTEGALSPHWTLFCRDTVETAPDRALAIGVARTPDMAPDLLGRRGQIALVADGVREGFRGCRARSSCRRAR